MINGKAPGRIAAEVVQSSIVEAPADVTLHELMEIINRNLRLIYEEYGILQDIKENAWKAPTACLLCYSHFHREIWQIGDSQCMIDGYLYTNEKQIDEITANARALFLEAELKKGKTISELLLHDTGWEYIKPLIQQQYYLQNDQENQFGFEVINGFDVDFSKVKVIKVSDQMKEIIFASDGYPVVKDTLEQTEAELDHLLQVDPFVFDNLNRPKDCKKVMFRLMIVHILNFILVRGCHS
ncbi:hypothetical protein ACI2OX_19120 [Bacillus sp. N9]